MTSSFEVLRPLTDGTSRVSCCSFIAHDHRNKQNRAKFRPELTWRLLTVTVSSTFTYMQSDRRKDCWRTGERYHRLYVYQYADACVESFPIKFLFPLAYARPNRISLLRTPQLDASPQPSAALLNDFISAWRNYRH